ncbi:MAG: pantoate--beta-alanine ligase [Pseudomonadota bacterium]
MAIPDKCKQLSTVDAVSDLREKVSSWKAIGKRVGLVPTMGALHTGHLSLVEKASSVTDKVIVSIFVNPEQFAPHEDFDTYPRGQDADLEKLAATACDLVYLPNISTIYPDGFETRVSLSEITEGLCGQSRPHFFGGVATVVNILFNQCSPDVAVFGEKDYQQLLVVKRMAKDLSLPIEIIGAPIVRDANGLALSSRNTHLTDNERVTANRLNRILSALSREAERGTPVEAILASGHEQLKNAGVDSIDYLEIRTEDKLTKLVNGPVQHDARLFLAVHIGKVRLIDNWPIILRTH